MTDEVLPPRDAGDKWPRSGFSSDSISIELPIFTSACMMRPPGPGMRTVSTAPNAFL